MILAALLATQVWSWTATPNATSYRIAWSEMKQGPWCKAKSLSFASYICSGGTCEVEIALPPTSVFLLVTASNKYGEGPTGHGELVICP